jgi:hypothetical protein
MIIDCIPNPAANQALAGMAPGGTEIFRAARDRLSLLFHFMPAMV